MGWALTITPSRTDVLLAPGQTIKTVLTILNEDVQAVHVEVSEKDWFVLPANKKFKISDWMKIHGSQQFVLKSHKKRKVKLTLQAPLGAEGELVGMTSFLYRGETPSMITPMISVSSYLAIAGTQKVSGEISDLSVADIPDHLRVLVTVKNTGNVHLRPTGALTVLSPTGDLIKRFQIPVESAPAYPGNARAYVGEDPLFKLKPGDYQLRADLTTAGLSLTQTRDFKIGEDGKIHMGEKK